MKKSISLKSHHLDVPSAEDWDFLGRLLKSITLGLDKDGVGPVTFNAIPLCPEHHRGRTGVHGLGTKRFVKQYGFTEQELLNEVYQLIKELK